MIATPVTAGAGDPVFAAGESYGQVTGYPGDNFPSWQDLLIPQNDGQFHDWETFTLSFSAPTPDPVVTLGSGGALESASGQMRAAVGSRAAIPAATTATGNTITPTLTILPNSTPGYQIATGNTIAAAPGSIGLDTANRIGTATSNRGLIQALVDLLVPDKPAVVSRFGGDVRVDTGGVPVSSLTFRIGLTAVVRSDADQSGIIDLVTPRVSVHPGTEVSGSTTPPSYGAATHTVSDLRFGSDSVAAYGDTSLTAPTAGVAGDNSDSGYDALSAADMTSLTGSFNSLEAGKPVTITVPLSGVNHPAAVRAWLDFGRDGSFDAEDASTLMTVGAGSTSAQLTFTVPEDVLAGPTWLRLRTSYDASQLDSATGWGSSGEVEDYPLTIVQGLPLIVIVKTDSLPSGANATVGQQVTYTITVTNQSSTQKAPTPTVKDPLPSNLAFVSTDHGGTESGGEVTWNLNDIPPGGTVTLTLVTVVTANATITTNTVTVDTPLGCATLGQGAQCTDTDVFPAAKASLDITKTGPATASILANVQYTITVRNTGGVAATNVVATDLLPAGASFVAMVDGPAPTDPTASVLTWKLGSLAPGAAVSLTLTVHYGEQVQAGDTETNRASVDSDQGCTPGNNNSCTAAVDTKVVAPSGGLTLVKTSTIVGAGGRTVATAGDQVVYTFVVTSGANLPITVTGIADPMLDTASVAINCGTLPVDLAPGASLTCTSAPYTVTAADVAAGKILNVATAAGRFPNGDNVPSSPGSDTRPTAEPSLKLTKTGPATVTAGQQFSYRIVVVNNGTVPARAVTVTDTLPASLHFEAGTPKPTVHDQTLGWTIAQLAPGAEQVFTVVVTLSTTAATGDEVTNTAVATTPAGCSGSCRDSATSTIVAPNRLVIEKTAWLGKVPATTALPGETIGYRITVTNKGIHPVSGARITDSLAAVLDDARVTGTPHASTGQVSLDLSARTLSWTGDLAAGAQAVISYEVVARAGGDGSVDNVVVAHSAVPSNCDTGSTDPACRTHTKVLVIGESTGGRDTRGTGAGGTASAGTNPSGPVVRTPGLAFTGADAVGLVALAGIVIVGGVLAVVLGRRRSR